MADITTTSFQSHGVASRPVPDHNLSFGYVDNTGLSRFKDPFVNSTFEFWLNDYLNFCICINILDFMSKPILFETSCDVVYLENLVTLETKERLFHYSSRN